MFLGLCRYNVIIYKIRPLASCFPFLCRCKLLFITLLGSYCLCLCRYNVIMYNKFHLKCSVFKEVQIIIYKSIFDHVFLRYVGVMWLCIKFSIWNIAYLRETDYLCPVYLEMIIFKLTWIIINPVYVDMIIYKPTWNICCLLTCVQMIMCQRLDHNFFAFLSPIIYSKLNVWYNLRLLSEVKIPKLYLSRCADSYHK